MSLKLAAKRQWQQLLVNALLIKYFFKTEYEIQVSLKQVAAILIPYFGLGLNE